MRTLAQTYAQVFAKTNEPRSESPEQWQKVLERFGCGPDSIGFRSGVDLGVLDIERANSSITEKMQTYARFVKPYFANLIQEEKSKNLRAAKDILHVSCTGYLSPSPVQQVLSQEKRNSRVTHFYHMGCYAAFPAVRWAALRAQSQADRTQVVHSELCSLHFRPSEQTHDWIVQSLFADGFVSYDVSQTPDRRCLQVLASAEKILPESLDLMTWNLAPQAFAMTLSREVPARIAGEVETFVKELIKPFANARAENILFAVHPGGPKIIQQVQKSLGLQDAQVAFSKDILFNYGNMSSATVPHIWHKIVNQPELKNGTYVVSLAFGPGLTIAGQLAQVVGEA